MSDTFRAADLTEEHLGWWVRTRQYEGWLRGLIPARDGSEHVQLLIVDGDGPFLPAIPVGEPVEVTLDPP